MLWGLCAATVQQRGEPLTILAFPPVLRPPARHGHAAILHIYSLPQPLAGGTCSSGFSPTENPPPPGPLSALLSPYAGGRGLLPVRPRPRTLWAS